MMVMNIKLIYLETLKLCELFRLILIFSNIITSESKNTVASPLFIFFLSVSCLTYENSDLSIQGNIGPCTLYGGTSSTPYHSIARMAYVYYCKHIIANAEGRKETPASNSEWMNHCACVCVRARVKF